MKELESLIKEYLAERAWDRLRPGDLAKSVSIEAAELLEVFQWTNPSLEEVREDEKRLEAVKGELADVLIYCLDMSVLLGLDTESIIKEKLERAKEKYPAHLFKGKDGNEKAGSEEAYLKIKKEFRMRSG